MSNIPLSAGGNNDDTRISRIIWKGKRNGGILILFVAANVPDTMFYQASYPDGFLQQGQVVYETPVDDKMVEKILEAIDGLYLDACMEEKKQALKEIKYVH
jgi:hypothetical protein